MVTPPAAKPLAGIRVLDLTRFVSGAYCTMVLDALGADVIKVEGLPGGDPYRAQGAVQVGSLSGLFASLNTGKRSIAVDLRAPDGTGLVRTLAQASDVFVENARPGSLERAGLGPDRLHALNPRLVYASISGFGQAGPDAARGGFDLILQAASGIMAVTGNEAGGPVKVGAPVLDIGAGMSAATAIMAALFARTADGLGRTVSSSLLEFALSCFTSYAADILETGTSPGLLGNDSPQFAPYGVFRCRDGSLALAGAGSEPLWLKLCDVLGRPDWPADPRFATNADRLRHRAELTAEIERVLTRETAAHWQQALDGAGIPASPVLPPAAALTSAQAEALQIRQAARTPDGYGYQTVRPPLSVASHPDEPAGPAGPSAGGPSAARSGPSADGSLRRRCRPRQLRSLRRRHPRLLTRRARPRPAHRRDPPRSRARPGGHHRPGRPRDRGRMSPARPEPPAPASQAPGQPGTGQPGTGELARQVLDRTIALCGIPAPPRHEQQRAAVIRDWWSADGLDAVTVDGAGNVRARLRAGDPGRPAVLLCAHLDTVFGPEITHAVVRHGGRLSGPGVGDNTVAVCALGALDALLPGDLRHPVWIVATTGEEGLGQPGRRPGPARRPARPGPRAHRPGRQLPGPGERDRGRLDPVAGHGHRPGRARLGGGRPAQRGTRGGLPDHRARQPGPPGARPARPRPAPPGARPARPGPAPPRASPP